jgi:hypothetical protein
MGRLLAAVLAVALACSAHAGGNPDVRMYMTFDSIGDYVHHIDEPPPYTTLNAYVYMDQIESGVTTVYFRMLDPVLEWPGVLATSVFTVLWPS